MAEEVLGASDSPDLGVTADAGAETASGAESEPELFTVKVGGREEKVSLDEALKGYQRGEDYTRKTQALATRERELQQYVGLANWIQEKPEEAVRTLAAQFNISLTDKQVDRMAAQVGDDDDPLARIERQFNQLTSKLTAREQADLEAQQSAKNAEATKQQILNEVSDLHEKHGDFVDLELMNYALEHGFSNMAQAYKAWQFDAMQDQRIAEQNAKVEAKRKGQIVEGGTSRAPGAVTPSGKGGKTSIHDAFMAALADEVNA
jgi:DNA repair exonuclease SbcCD ATPase subunit